jgi:hypothetical protein
MMTFEAKPRGVAMARNTDADSHKGDAMNIRTTLTLSILTVLFLVGCQGGGGNENRRTPTPTATPKPSPTPAAFSKALETPCPGKLSVSHAYSECGRDGFWHVVQDDYYFCEGGLKAFRVHDTPTIQPCKASSGTVVAAPNPVGIGLKDFHQDSSCRAPKGLDRTITISVCENNVWINKTYKLYECLEDGLAITEPPDKTDNTGVHCDQPPPPPK